MSPTQIIQGLVGTLEKSAVSYGMIKDGVVVV